MIKILYAINKSREKILAFKRGRAICPFCEENLIAKCGKIKQWHWAHNSLRECDIWNEGESEWHINWKKSVKPEFCEVNCGEHIADIKINGVVIELQHSPLSVEMIEKREEYYKKMIWLLDGNIFAKNLELRLKKSYYTFRWKWPSKSIWMCQKPVFFHLYSEDWDVIFHLKKIYRNIPCGGWGRIMSKEQFKINFLTEKIGV